MSEHVALVRFDRSLLLESIIADLMDSEDFGSIYKNRLRRDGRAPWSGEGRVVGAAGVFNTAARASASWLLPELLERVPRVEEVARGLPQAGLGHSAPGARHVDSSTPS